MERQYIVCLVLGLACVGLAMLVALLTPWLSVLVLVAAVVALRLHALLDGIATRRQPAHAVAPARRRRARG